MLGVPLLREGEAHRRDRRSARRSQADSLTEKQIALLKTFADQAVIAIENVRLFNETKEALEQQTATAEILKVISSSPTDVQPVFDAIVRKRRARCSRRAMSRSAASTATNSCMARRGRGRRRSARRSAQRFPMPLNRTSVHRARDARAPDGRMCTTATATPTYPLVRVEAPGTSATARASRAADAGGRAIGAIIVVRAEPGGRSSDKQIALLQTFADQAVIAIENVRLFNETQGGARAADRDQRDAAGHQQLDRSTLQPVLDRSLESAAQLCDADAAASLGGRRRRCCSFGRVRGGAPTATMRSRTVRASRRSTRVGDRSRDQRRAIRCTSRTSTRATA